MADLHVDWQMHFWAEYLWMASVHCRQERNSGQREATVDKECCGHLR
jgi:hypothetical protein